MKSPKMSELEMSKLWSKAWDAGEEAAKAMVPSPMVVRQHANMMDDSSPVENEWFVADGVCGFAWVQIKPGNSRFANFLKKEELARPDSYLGGVSVWVSQYNQSMQRKEAHARAMAEVFRKAGINAWAMSRMD